MRFISIFGLLLLLVALTGVGVMWSSWYRGEPGESINFEVYKGDNFIGLAKRLNASGVINDTRAYRWFVNFFANGHVLKRGEYVMAKNMAVADAVETLISGKVLEHKFTIAEGSNMFQIAEQLEKAGITSAEGFLAAVKKPEVLRQIRILEEGKPFPAESAEGFLAPNTYYLQKIFSPEEIAIKFIEQFNRSFGLMLANNAIKKIPPELKDLGLGWYEIIILASLIEKETGSAHERPMVASIFLNRLKKHMRMQCDPTTIYGMWLEKGSFDGKIHKSDLQRDDGYNTYVVPRLPKGPIANPGVEAMEAVLKPAETDYLYFVSNNDGTHSFSANYRDHQQNVERTQLDPNARDGKSWRQLPKEQRANQAHH